MFKKKEVSNKRVNEVIDLASKNLKITYFLLSALSIYLVLLLFKETSILHLLWSIIKIVSPLFIGILIAWLFDPFVKWLQTKKIKRSLGALITYLILFIIIFLILSSLIPLLINQIAEFARIAPNVFDSIKDWCLDILNYLTQYDYINAEDIKTQFFNKFNDFAVNITNDLPIQLFNIISAIFSGMGTLLLGFIIGFFLLVSFDNSSSFKTLIPQKVRETSIDLIYDINNSLRKYVQGAIIDCTVVFLITSIGLWSVGLKAPALFGFFCGLTNIIPYLGPYIGGTPAVIVGFTQSPTIGLLTLLVIAIVQVLEGNFLQPYIMSKTTKIQPVIIILGLLVFGHFFGIIGMLLSTPIISVVKTIYEFFQKKYKFLEEKEINDTDVQIEISKIKHSVK